jgi:hypothetical protein
MKTMNDNDVLRAQLLALLGGGNAHMGFEAAVADFPLEHINRKPSNVGYTPWHLLEHLRLSQWDILEFVQNPDHVSPPWPSGYWPDPEQEADGARWQQSLDQFRANLAAVQALAADPETDLFGPIPHAPGYTIFREILLVADHNAYHVGEFAILRQVMNTWPADRVD